MKKISMIIVGLIIFFLTIPSIVYAYLDPGTGSYFLQLIAAAFLGGLFAIKLYWKKFKTSLKIFFIKKEKVEKN